MKLLVARGCVSGLRRYLPPQASSLLEATPAVFCGLATASGAARTVCAYLLGTLYLDPAAFLFGGGPWRAEWEESPQPTSSPLCTAATMPHTRNQAVHGRPCPTGPQGAGSAGALRAQRLHT